MSRSALRLAVGLLFLGIPGAASAAEPPLTAQQAAAHLGEARTVCGLVASTKYLPKANGQPTLLNLPKPYPDHAFTIVIFGEHRSLFPQPPEVFYKGKQVCVTGEIKDYRSKPEIVVEKRDQLKVVQRP